MKANIKSDVKPDIKNKAVIGTFEGECADATITNLNGLDITREVWEGVFASDDYKKAIEHGWYIGFLGHPEDPACQDFEHAGIVMTEGHIDENGKVYGKFNLIDTPVGRIIKTFIDGGVKFGISVRGAGDIISNSVDPETFIFRGFDIVTFPAYPDAIPTFTEIAASANIEDQKKYQRICASVENNIEGLNTESAINMVQTYFAKQSSPYQMLEKRKAEIHNISATQLNDILGKKVSGLTELFIRGAKQNKLLTSELNRIRKDVKCSEIKNKRKLNAVKRITASQVADLGKSLEDEQLKNSKLSKINASLKIRLKDSEKNNLKYKCKIDASTKLAEAQKVECVKLQTKTSETVRCNSQLQSKISNLESRNRQLSEDNDRLVALLASYQNAYANMYASVVGVHLDNISIDANTSVKELQRIVGNTTYTNKVSEPVEVIEDLPDGLISV